MVPSVASVMTQIVVSVASLQSVRLSLYDEKIRLPHSMATVFAI